MIGYPLDSHVVFGDNGVPEYDRAISSAPLRELIKRLFSDGVLPDIATNLQVQFTGSARVSGVVEGDTDTYNVVVNPGFGICSGCLKLQENYYGLTLNTASTTNPRIDTVVLRLNDNDSVRSCEFFIVQGTPSPNPVAPALTRNSSVWEIGLANLYKPSVVSNTSPVTVTDTRLDPDRCGVISSISEFDTSAMYDQVQAAMEHYEEVTQAEFDAWFESVRGQLSTDAAGNLQAQIGTLVNLVTDSKVDLVSAINEIARGRLHESVVMYVSTSGNDVAGNGTSDAPFRTIARALNSLPKNLNGFSASVYIAAGMYPETIRVADFFGGVVTLTGIASANVTVTGLDIRHCNVLLSSINLSVTTGGVYVGTRGMLYVPSGSITISGATEAITLRYGAILEVTTTLTINNAGRALQVQYASTASVATLAGTGNNIGIYAYHSAVHVRTRTLVATTQVINENSTISMGGAVG